MNVYRSIDKEKVQFDFLVHTDKECDFDAEIRELGGRIFSVPSYRVLNYVSYKKALTQFFQDHPEHRIVHGHIGSSAAIYLHEARKQGRYTIAHSHSAFASVSPSGLAFAAASYPTRYVADYFFGCTEEAGIRRFGAKIVRESGRFSVVNNGVDLEKYAFSEPQRQRKREELGVQNRLVVGHVGRLTYAKNHSFLLQLFKELHTLDPSFYLLLVGGGELQDKVESEIQKLGIEDAVYMTGSVNDVPAWLAGMDLFVFPSHYEGLPVSLIEAQAMGLPCVVSEAVDDMAMVTDYIRRLSLKDSMDKWVLTCMEMALCRDNAARENYRLLKNKGFDIKDVAKYLQDFYYSHLTVGVK